MKDKMELLEFGKNSCIVCESPYVFYLRDVITIRTKKLVPLFCCLHCRSFFNPSGYIEDERVLRQDVAWNIKVANRNEKWAIDLIGKLKSHLPKVRSILEIGCGIGTFLKVAREYGMKTLGYDTNLFAIEYGVQNFGLELRNGPWNADTIDTKFDVIACISVLEHQEEPRILLKNIAQYCKRFNTNAYISVPFIDEDRWKYILNPDPRIEGTPFFDCDVHVTHFSSVGFIRMSKAFASTSEIKVSAGGWSGYLLKF